MTSGRVRSARQNGTYCFVFTQSDMKSACISVDAVLVIMPCVEEARVNDEVLSHEEVLRIDAEFLFIVRPLEGATGAVIIGDLVVLRSATDFV